MIRAVIKDGRIQPLEPLPVAWRDGHQVVVDEPQAEAANGTEDADPWAEDMNALTAGLDDPQDWQQIEAVLAEADQLSKALVRREMGLP